MTHGFLTRAAIAASLLTPLAACTSVASDGAASETEAITKNVETCPPGVSLTCDRCTFEEGCKKPVVICFCDTSAPPPASPPAPVVPTVLASGLDFPSSVAVDKGNVYWTDRGQAFAGDVMRVAIGGGTPVTLASNLNDPMRLALLPLVASPVYGPSLDGYAAEVVWVNLGDSDTRTVGGSVMGLPFFNGNPGALATLTAGETAPGHVAVDAANVYWTTYTGVFQMPIHGGAITTLASAQIGAGGIAVDATSVYWVTEAGNVMKVAIGGGTPVTLASGQGNLTEIALDASSVYWTSLDLGTVTKIPVGGGALVTLVTGRQGNGPSSLAVDGSNVYWAESWGGNVMKVGVGGGGYVALATGQAPYEIAVDRTAVYWTDIGSVGSGSGSIKSVPK